MFQFGRCPPYPYGFRVGCHPLPGGGLPHSEIIGSMLGCSSPMLIAAPHVLPRHATPRHPPHAFCPSSRDLSPVIRTHRFGRRIPSWLTIPRCPRQEPLGTPHDHHSVFPEIPDDDRSIGIRSSDKDSSCRLFSSQRLPTAGPRHPSVQQSGCSPPCRGQPFTISTCIVQHKWSWVMRVVELRGLEPRTSCVQSRRSTT